LTLSETAQCTGKADRQQGAVSLTRQAVATHRDKSLELCGRQCSVPSGGLAMSTRDAAQGFAGA
jgi:hypothetical protein